MPDPSKRLLVLLLTIAGLVGVERVPIPFVDGDVLAMWNGDVSWAVPPAMSVGMLGVMPWLTAAVMVELVALMVPSWRALRTAGGEARNPLDRATRWLWLAMAVMQGFGMAVALESMRVGNVPLVADPGFFFRFVTVVSLVAGSAVCVGLCQWCTRNGLGAGLIVALGLMWSNELFLWWQILQLGEVAPVTPMLLLAAGLGLVGLRTPGRTLRLSVAGLVPLGAILQVLSVAYFDLSNPVPLLLVALVVTGLFAVLFQMPDLVATLKGVPQALVQRDLAVGVAVNAAVVAALMYGVLVLGIPSFGAEFFFIPAVLWDLVSEWRARQSGLNAEAWQLHRMYAIEPALDALNAAGIRAATRGDRTRSLLHFFGPFVPVGILVEPGREDEARSILRPLLSQARDAPPA